MSLTNLVLSSDPECLRFNFFSDLFKVGEPLLYVKELGILGARISECLAICMRVMWCDGKRGKAVNL